MSYQLQEINRRIDQDVKGFLEECDAQYAQKVSQAADAILTNLPHSPIVLLSGPSGSGKTTTALKIEEELKKRLKARNSETEEQIANRLERMEYEFSKKALYDYIVVNDTLENAERKLEEIIDGEKKKMTQGV